MIRAARLIGFIVALACAVEHGSANLGVDSASVSLGFSPTDSIIRAPHAPQIPGELRAMRSGQECVRLGRVRTLAAGHAVVSTTARVRADRCVTSIEHAGTRTHSSSVVLPRAGRAPPPRDSFLAL